MFLEYSLFELYGTSALAFSFLVHVRVVADNRTLIDGLSAFGFEGSDERWIGVRPRLHFPRECILGCGLWPSCLFLEE